MSLNPRRDHLRGLDATARVNSAIEHNVGASMSLFEFVHLQTQQREPSLMQIRRSSPHRELCSVENPVNEGLRSRWTD